MNFVSVLENEGRVGVIVADRQDGTYNRETLGFKFYDLQIRMSDSPTTGQSPMSATRELRVDIQSGNYYPQFDGTKDVTVYNYKRQYDPIDIYESDDKLDSD